VISVQEAQETILSRAQALNPAPVRLDQALGLTLAEPLHSDVDMPPFDKAAVDGFAVRAEDAEEGRVVEIVEEVMAGQVPTRCVVPGQGVRIMTGAPTPEGAETIVMAEDSEPNGDGKIRFTSTTPPERNICRQGEDLRSGAEIVPAGAIMRPQLAGVLAAQGHGTVRCHRRPTVGLLATGDEIVSTEDTPAAGQIRNANNYSLSSQARFAGAETSDLGVAVDRDAELSEAVRLGLEFDVLLLSGGVSAGALDLVPKVLASCGVETLFHHINIKPGRPVLYGVRNGTHVFGLPGNPVATFVCFEILVRPLIRKLMGKPEVGPHFRSATLMGEFRKVDKRERYVGGLLKENKSERTVTAIATHGPADLMALARSNCLIQIPPGTGPYMGGEEVQVVAVVDDSRME
jgi:molybdopterin molybdotransferase